MNLRARGKRFGFSCADLKLWNVNIKWTIEKLNEEFGVGCTVHTHMNMAHNVAYRKHEYLFFRI